MGICVILRFVGFFVKLFLRQKPYLVKPTAFVYC